MHRGHSDRSVELTTQECVLLLLLPYTHSFLGRCLTKHTVNFTCTGVKGGWRCCDHGPADSDVTLTGVVVAFLPAGTVQQRVSPPPPPTLSALFISLPNAMRLSASAMQEWRMGTGLCGSPHSADPYTN